MKIGVIGANGQLGHDVCLQFRKNGHDTIELNHDTIDISSLDSVHAVLKEVKPDIVINTAAMHNLDDCEANPLESFKVNSMGARNLSQVLADMNALLIHISTDYVFDGEQNRPYEETDAPDPLNVYGNTKLSGEYFIRSVGGKYFIVRVSGLYGIKPCRAKGGLNFIRLMLKLSKERDEIRVVDDEILTPTCTEDVARQLIELIKIEDYGVFHATSQGGCSWYAFAQKIFTLAKSDVRLSVARPGEFPAKVKRPKYSVLQNKRLQSNGIDVMRNWEESLESYIREIT